METILDLLDRAAARFPDAIALEGEEEGGGRTAITRTGLKRRAAALARALIAAGLRPGDPVALLSPNRPEWGVGYFGALLAGGVLVPLDVNLKAGELTNIIARSGAVALLTDAAEADRGAELRGLLKGARTLLRIDGEEASAPGDGAPP
ncbi:MAG: AMP-binding protein, partial [bacterium]